MKFIHDLIAKYKSGNLAIQLIFWNVILFILSLLLDALFRGFPWNWLLLPGDAFTFITRPWTILSYAFFHDRGDITHLLLNMVLLYFLGSMFLRYFRSTDFAQFYFGGALAGGLAFLAYSGIGETVSNMGSSVLLGASAAIYALLFAMVAYKPKQPVSLFLTQIQIPLDYVAYALIIWDTIRILMGDNSGGRISHFGGAIFGYAYMRQFEQGNAFLAPLFNWIWGVQVPKVRLKSSGRKKTASPPPRDDYDFQNYKSETQQKVDRILEKISASGYTSLTKEEKDFLFRSSKNS